MFGPLSPIYMLIPLYLVVVMTIIGMISPVYRKMHFAMFIIAVTTLFGVEYFLKGMRIEASNISVFCAWFDSLAILVLSYVAKKTNDIPKTVEEKRLKLKHDIYLFTLIVLFMITSGLNLYVAYLGPSFATSGLHISYDYVILVVNLLQAACLIGGVRHGITIITTVSSLKLLYHDVFNGHLSYYNDSKADNKGHGVL